MTFGRVDKLIVGPMECRRSVTSMSGCKTIVISRCHQHSERLHEHLNKMPDDLRQQLLDELAIVDTPLTAEEAADLKGHLP